MLEIVASHRGDWDHAAQLHAESAQLARELGDSWLLSIAVNNLGDVALNRGEYERALELFEESLAIRPGAPGSGPLRSCVPESRPHDVDARRRPARSLAGARQSHCGA
jgi:hypothetical protein